MWTSSGCLGPGAKRRDYDSRFCRIGRFSKEMCDTVEYFELFSRFGTICGVLLSTDPAGGLGVDRCVAVELVEGGEV